MRSMPERATARPMAIMSRKRRRPWADAARLGASPTVDDHPLEATQGLRPQRADGPSTKTREFDARSAAAQSAASNCRANRPKPRRLDRQLPSIPILMSEPRR